MLKIHPSIREKKHALPFYRRGCSASVYRARLRGATVEPNLRPAPSTYVNDDASATFDENTISYFLAGGSPSAPSLTYQNSVRVGGVGGGGGNFGASSIVAQPSSHAQCLYVSNAGSGQIGVVALQSQQLAGVFTGSANDAGTSNGIVLALNQNNLYASFTDSNTVGTFQILAGCQLSFVGDISVAGLNGGGIHAMTYGHKSLLALHLNAVCPSR